MSLLTDLQAYYQCNDASDTMGNHPATFNSVSVGSGTGKFGDSWDFASTAAYVSLASPTPNSSSFTATAWAFNLRPDSAYRTLFYNGVGGGNGGMHFLTAPGSALAGSYTGTSSFVSTGTALAAASYTGWHHYAVVGSGGTFTLYVDGTAIGAVAPTWPGTFAIAQIGGDSYGEGFAERLDDVAIWNRALSASEVNQVFGTAGGLISLITLNTNLVFNAPLGTDGNDVINGLAGATSSVSFVTDTGFTAADFASGSAGVSYGIDSAQGPAVLGTSSFTLSGWVKPATPVNPGAIIIGTTISGVSSPQYSGYQLRLNGTNLEFMIGGGGANEIPVSSSITFSAWHHVAVTRSGTAIVLYIDGAVVDTGTAGAVYDTANTWSGHFLTSGMTTDGSSYFYGYNGLISDTAMWKRALSGAEITSIYNAGTAKLSSLTALHLQGQFSTVVHSEVAENLRLEGQWSTVVHNQVAENLRLEGQFATVVHSVPPPAAIVPDITGTPGVAATFDGSASTSVSYYYWSWVSTPGGSSITTGPVPFPDGGAVTPIDMTDNQGLYHFEGNANDTSGNARNGTVNGATQVTGKVGPNAYSFDGSNDYITCGANFAFTTSDFTVSFWMNPDASQNNYQQFIGCWGGGTGDGWFFEQNAGNSGQYRFQSGDGSSWKANGNYMSVPASAWSHIVLVRVGAVITGYLNGVAVYTDVTATTIGGHGNFVMGGSATLSNFWQGLLDEVALWDRELSASEVLDIYNLQQGIVGTSSTFTFTPDIEGTYQINLAIDGSTNTNANCVVTLPAAGGGDPSQGASLQGGALQGSGVDLQGYT